MLGLIEPFKYPSVQRYQQQYQFKINSNINNMTVPPRFVPTLTDRVTLTESAVAPQSAAMPAAVRAAVEEQITQRVMQRIDVVLERRLREAVAQVILSHTQTLGPRLRDEIQLVVLESVQQAVAQEMKLPGWPI